MAVLYVASNQRGAGKTALCTTLAYRLSKEGKRAVVLKPLAGPDDRDAGIFEQLLGQGKATGTHTVPEGGLTSALLDAIKAAADEAMDGQDVLLVEGTTDVSPRDSERVVEALDAKAVVVEWFQPGLDVTRLSEWRALLGERLLGCIVNGMTRYQAKDVSSRLLPSIESEGLVSLGVIPEDRMLLGVSVEQLASHLDGRYIVGAQLTNGLVERFLVGGLGMDSGLDYFGLRENKAAIVRGDRPDIQMAALQTPTTCMVLTEGIEPIEYVLNEAELEEVPILLVESDTIITMETLSTVQERARFDHPAKLERYAELLERHLDVSAIYAGLGLPA